MRMKLVIKIFALFISVVLLVAAVIVVVPVFESGNSAAVPGSADWMSRLDDGLPINEISLPGSHDCATEYVQLAFFSKCQSSSIKEQLEMGYRYLDIRLGVDDSGMKLMHGFTNCKSSLFGDKLYLESVLRQCYEFLHEHPSETIIFAVKQEHGNESVAEFESLLDSSISENSEMWYAGDTLPALGQARAKLILLRRYDDEAHIGAASGLNINWVNQPGSSNTALNIELTETPDANLYVQDRYEYNTADKWNAFTAGIEFSDDNCGSNNIFINFLSTKGSLAYGHPFYFASKLNKMLLNEDFESVDFTGWVITDFNTAELAEKIYSLN